MMTQQEVEDRLKSIENVLLHLVTTVDRFAQKVDTFTQDVSEFVDALGAGILTNVEEKEPKVTQEEEAELDKMLDEIKDDDEDEDDEDEED